MEDLPIGKTGLSDLLERQYGVKTTVVVNPLIVALPAALTRVVSSNPQRLGLTIMNLGATSMYLAPDNLVSVTRGLLLVPNGGIVSFRWDVDFTLCSYEWFGISVAAPNAIFTLEVRSL